MSKANENILKALDIFSKSGVHYEHNRNYYSIKCKACHHDFKCYKDTATQIKEGFLSMFNKLNNDSNLNSCSRLLYSCPYCDTSSLIIINK